jgi:hypothetical protein
VGRGKKKKKDLCCFPGGLVKVVFIEWEWGGVGGAANLASFKLAEKGVEFGAEETRGV